MRVNLFVATASLLAYTGLAIGHKADDLDFYDADLAQSFGDEWDYDTDLAETYGMDLKVNALKKKIDLSKGKKPCCCKKKVDKKEEEKKVEKKEEEKKKEEPKKEEPKKEEPKKPEPAKQCIHCAPCMSRQDVRNEVKELLDKKKPWGKPKIPKPSKCPEKNAKEGLKKTLNKQK